jgi:hypothetical protein
MNDISRTGVLPNLIIIGAAKCGTSSLHYYLGLHPQITMSMTKELNFFVREHNWDKGIDWYKGNFTGIAKIHGEASPKYTTFPIFDGVAERMHSLVPEAKLIYLVRDPIERIVSQYVHYYAEGRDNRTIAEAVANPDASPYVLRSKYHFQLQPFLRHYPPSRILIIEQGDLFHRRKDTLTAVFRFLEVDDRFQARGFSRVHHKTRDKRRLSPFGRRIAQLPGMGALARWAPSAHWHVERLLIWPFSRKVRRPVLDSETRAMLADYLKEDVGRFKAYVGRDFEGWCL